MSVPPNQPPPGQPPYGQPTPYGQPPQTPFGQGQSPYGQPPPQPPYGPPPPRKSNTGKIVLFSCGGCLVLLILGTLALVGLGKLGQNIAKNSAKDSAGTTTSPSSGSSATGTASVASEDRETFTNSREGLNDTLAADYIDFSFSYPKTWTLDREGTQPGKPNFVKVSHENDQGVTQENFAVGHMGFTGNPTPEQQEQLLPQLANQLSDQFAQQFSGYEKVSEGETTVNGYKGYQFRLKADVNGIPLWGRVVLLPGGNVGADKGVVLIMLATDRASDVTGPEDVGEKGELPSILSTFHYGPGTSS